VGEDGGLIAGHAERDRGPTGQSPGEFHRDGGEVFIGNDTVDETER
jgi:hypothetical protein